MRSAAVALALVLLAPSAFAAAFSFQGERRMEVEAADARAVFEMPFVANEEGFVYAKLLAVSGNVVHDGARANGSVADATGWRVTFELRRSNGSTTPLGSYVDGTATPRVDVARGEDLALRILVDVAGDAPPARYETYVALAFRPTASGSDPGSSSGAKMDEAKAMTLGITLRTDGGLVGAPRDDTSAAPGDAPPPAAPRDEAETAPQPDQSPEEVPPVAEIPVPTVLNVHVDRDPLPMWVVVLGGALGAAILFALVAILYVLRLVLREERLRTRAVQRAVDEEIELREIIRARPIPVHEDPPRDALEERP